MRASLSGGSLGRGGWFLVVVALFGADAAARADDTMAPASQPRPALEDETTVSLSRLAELEQRAGNGGAEETPAEAPVTAGWDKKDGFFISSADKNFLLKIAGRLQVRYTYKGRDERGDPPPPPAGTDEERGVDDSFFELERARVAFSGHVLSPNVTYMFLIDGDTDGAGVVETLDAYVQYKASKSWMDNDLFSIAGGQWKPHFLRSEAQSSGRQQFVERSLANEFFNIDRCLGAWIEGSSGPVYYEVAVTNGWDSINLETADVDNIPGFSAKLDFTLLGDNEKGRYEESNFKNAEDPLFVVGFSGAADASNGSSGVGPPEWQAYQFGIDGTFKWSIFSLVGEYMGRWLDYDAPAAPAGGDTSTNYAHGFYVQAGLFLIPETLEVSGRASAVLSDAAVQGGSGFEAGPAVSWYISKSHKVKLQSDVMYFDISDDLPPASESLDSSSAFASSAANIQEGEQGIMWRTQLQLEF